ncbi:MAG: hypothetical protein ACM31C_34735 [Acidobacteriota bacterium]
MRLLWLAIAVTCGCVDTLDADGQQRAAVDRGGAAPDIYDLLSAQPDICGFLPACGACALACDPEKLAQEYVPPGACALFACTLTDGRTIRLDVCNPP